jgi:hypothetical protein
MAPAVETRAIADLDSSDPDVVITAAQTLGHHGSPAALEPLRTAFRRWHVTWADRGAELAYSPVIERPHARQAMVEDAFRQAIGAGHGWVLRASDLRELQQQCVTDNCRTQTGVMIHDDDTTILLWGINEPDESRIELAQYRFSSIAGLEEKLSQYPPGTSFVVRRMDATGDVAGLISRLVAFAGSRGLSIIER